MSARTILLRPVDAWFFRDGRPYNKEEAAQADVPTLFPPWAPTVVGTIRAALASGQGWNGRGRWAEGLNPVLGNGFEELGQLQFQGPFLVRNGEWLFPVPLHLRGGAAEHPVETAPRWSPAAFLAPSAGIPLFDSDLGLVPLPVPVKPRGWRGPLAEPSDMWITATGYGSILRGKMPDAATLLPSSALWKAEQRVGLARHPESRAAEEGALYGPTYVRLEQDVALALVVQGIPPDWELPGLIAFGGESRMAHCESAVQELPLPQEPLDMIRASNRFTVSLLTPLCLPSDPSQRLAPPMPQRPFPGLAGSKVVSACVGKPIPIGGWDSLDRRPLPLVPCLPPGSTWFCAADPAALDSLLAWHGRRVGERTPFGFGQIALGAWPQKTGDAA